MDLGKEELDNEVVEENRDLVLEFLGFYSEEDFDVQVTRDTLNAMPRAEGDLSNAVLYLRDQGILDVRPARDTLFVGLKEGATEEDLGDLEDYVGCPDLDLDGDTIYEDELEEVAANFGEALQDGKTSISASEIDEMFEEDDIYQKLNILSGTGYLEIFLDDGELFYTPDVEKADELKDMVEEELHAAGDDRISRGGGPERERYYRNNPWKPPF